MLSLFLSLVAAQPVPRDLAQADDVRGVPQAPGFVDDDPRVALRAAPDLEGVAWVEVEVKPHRAPFTETGLLTGSVAFGEGGTSEVVATLANGDYHWRARSVDGAGARSEWVEFDPTALPDFTIAAPPAPPEPEGGGGEPGPVVFDGDDGGRCGALGLEGLLLLIAPAISARRRS